MTNDDDANRALADRYAARCLDAAMALGMLFEVAADPAAFRLAASDDPLASVTALLTAALARRRHHTRAVRWGDDPASAGWTYLALPAAPVMLAGTAACVDLDLAVRGWDETYPDEPVA